MTSRDELLDYLCDQETHLVALRATLGRWLETSRRYAGFVAANRDKIRKKIRLQSGPDALEDLRWELAVGYLLHLDKRFTLTYEPYTRGQPFGPDYTVAYTTSFTFDVEVTRVRRGATVKASALGDDGEGDGTGDDDVQSSYHRRVIDAILGKLTQLTPNTPNVLVVGTADGTLDADGLANGMKQVRRRIQAGDLAILSRYGFQSPAHFSKHFGRLNTVIARPTTDQVENASATLFWSNGAATSASAALPARATTALRQCLG